MSQSEFDREKIRVYWDSKRSYIMTTLGGLFGLTLTAFTISNALIQTSKDDLVVVTGAVMAMTAIFLVFTKALVKARKKLDEIALRTYDLFDKAAKNQPINDDLRKLHGT